MNLHNFNEDKNLNAWGEVFINGERASLTYSRVSAVPYNICWQGSQRNVKDTEEAPFVSFESDDEVEIRVKSDRIKENSDLIVRPQSKGVIITRKGNEVAFLLKEYGAYTFEIDGFHEALHLFYNPARDFFAEEIKAGRKILHYEAGIHDIGNVCIDSHTSVIVDAGAVVYGSITAKNAEDVRVCGYGIIDGSKEIRYDDSMLPAGVKITQVEPEFRSEYTDEDLTDVKTLEEKLEKANILNGIMRFYNCKNFSIEGVTMRDSSIFCLIPAACEDFIIDNVKTIGMWRYNSDGIDLFNCRNAVIKNSFLRNFDDCMVIKGIVGWDKINNENILVENLVVWCDWGSALEIGAETNANEYNNIIFRNCDVIHGVHAVMRLNHHNRALIRNIVYDGINAEYTKYQLPAKFIEAGKEYDGKQNESHPYLIAGIIINDNFFGKDNLHGVIDGVKAVNTKVYKDDEVEIPRSVFYGIDEDHKVKNVFIENVYLNNEKIKDYDKYFDNMKFTENVKYK